MRKNLLMMAFDEERRARKGMIKKIRRDIGIAKSLRLRIQTATPLERWFLPSIHDVEETITTLKGLLEGAKTASPKTKWISWDSNGNSYSKSRKAYYFEAGKYSSRLFGTWGI